MCSQCNKKLNRKLNTIKCCSKYLHICTPQVFFLPPIGRWLLYRKTYKHKGFAVYNDKQPQVQNLKWRHLFLGGRDFFSQHLFYTVLNFFYSIIFLDNVSIPIVLEHCVWTEPLFGSLFRRSQVLCTLCGEHFKLIFFPSETIFKGSVPLCEAEEISRGPGKAGVGRSSCLQLLGKGPFPWFPPRSTTTFSCNFSSVGHSKGANENLMHWLCGRF